MLNTPKHFPLVLFWPVETKAARYALQVFAPANLRAAADNKPYADFVSTCISEKYSLRYTGGFVPDVHHILTKVSL